MLPHRGVKGTAVRSGCVRPGFWCASGGGVQIPAGFSVYSLNRVVLLPFTNQHERRSEEGMGCAGLILFVPSGDRDAAAEIGGGQALAFQFLLGQPEGLFLGPSEMRVKAFHQDGVFRVGGRFVLRIGPDQDRQM